MYVDIFKRDKNAEVSLVGRVAYTDGKVIFTGLLPQFKARLASGIRVEDIQYTPEDGEKYIEALPLYLRGDRLWATLPKE